MDGITIKIKEIKDGNRRKLYKRQGTRFALVVRVSSKEGFSPTFTSSTLSEKLFGSGGNTTRSGFSSCSGGKLDFAPAVGNNIVNGVMELTIPQNVKDVGWKSVQHYVTGELYNSGVSMADHDNIVIVLPSQVDFQGAAAWAYVSYNIGVFKDTFIRYQLVMVSGN